MNAKLPHLGFERPLFVFIGTFSVYAFTRIGVFGSKKVELYFGDEFTCRGNNLLFDSIKFYSKKRNEYSTIRSFRPISISYRYCYEKD